jgi:hypothetical protein
VRNPLEKTAVPSYPGKPELQCQIALRRNQVSLLAGCHTGQEDTELAGGGSP